MRGNPFSQLTSIFRIPQTVIWLAFPERADNIDGRHNDGDGFLRMAREHGFESGEVHRDGFISVQQLEYMHDSGMF